MTTLPLAAPRVRERRPALLTLLVAWILAGAKRQGARLTAAAQVAVRLVLTVAGLGWIDFGVWHGAGVTWGAVAVGVSALVLEAVVKR